MSANVTIRTVLLTDVERIADIYGHHVEHGTATFDTIPPDREYWATKIDDILGRNWPFLVADEAGNVVGYAYATQFRDRAAYRKTCENSIYVDQSARGKGVGSRLLTELAVAARKTGFRQMIGVIGGREPASVALHEKCGFALAGRMRNVGYKFGKYLDTVYVELDLTA